MANLDTIGGLHYEMMKRCYNEKSIAYKDYGAKGIEVCDEWKDREEFRKWCKENGWNKNLRLNRKDGSKNYCPDNCYFGNKYTASSIKSQHTKKVRLHRKNMKELCGVPKKYSNLSIYKIFIGMHSRCELESNTRYEKYGGRGIRVCDEWSGKDGFFYFYKWSIDNGYKNGLSIDRINNNDGYSPDNCRWATSKEQVMNRRISKNFIINGKEFNLKDIAKSNGTTYSRLYLRVIKKGMSIEEALEDIKTVQSKKQVNRKNTPLGT